MENEQSTNYRKEAMSATIVTGFKLRITLFLLRMNILVIALSVYHDPIKAVQALKALIRKKKAILGSFTNSKLYHVGRRYYWSIASVGWPSRSFHGFIRNELNKALPFDAEKTGLQTIIFSITSRCPLHCEHCYEWNNLSAEETLSREQLEFILSAMQTQGISNIQFSGGEPLSRFEELIHLVKLTKNDTDTWILTSGFGLTPERANSLKNAGLTGVVISLDHWDENEHNRFRSSDESFHWAMEAAKNASTASMAVAFSLCAGREFVNSDNLIKYLKLANSAGAGLIRILEPRDVGHYQGQDIELSPEQIEILNQFYIKVNSDAAYSKMPLVEYTGYHQRISGCFGAGERYLYVDSIGDVHACPFCQNAVGNALKEPVETLVTKLMSIGCHKFHQAKAQ